MREATYKHLEAWAAPRAGFETAIRDMYLALDMYARRHARVYGSPIGEDGFMGIHWRNMALALIGLLNGDCGRLDCGYLDSSIRDLAHQHGVVLE